MSHSTFIYSAVLRPLVQVIHQFLVVQLFPMALLLGLLVCCTHALGDDSDTGSATNVGSQGNVLQLTEKEQAYLQQKKVIRKCVDPLWMPLEGINQSGEHVGVIADISRMIEERIGVPVKLVPTKDWAESMALLKQRKCDVVTSDAAASPETTPKPKQNYYKKTHKFLDLTIVYITRQEVPRPFSFSTIRQHPVGIPKDYPTIPLVQQIYGQDTNIVEVSNTDEGIKKVSSGELYSFIGSLPVVSYSMEKQGLTNLIVSGHLDLPVDVVMAVRSDEPELLAIFNKGIASVDPKVTNHMVTNWIETKYDLGFYWKELSKYLFIIVALLAAMWIWNRKLKQLNEALDQANAELEKLSETDQLTSLKNRNFFHNRLPDILRLAYRNKLSMSVAIVDIDHFKPTNDKYGHPTGDKCLIAMAENIRAVFRRDSDYSIRYGGDEFVILCIGNTPKELRSKLDDLKNKVALEKITAPNGKTISHTCSIGYTHHPQAPQDWQDSLMEEADQQLYLAKESGRNTVIGIDHVA